MLNTRIALIASLCVLAGCKQDRTLTAPVDLVQMAPKGGLQAFVQQQAGQQAGTVEYVVRVVGHDAEVAAYQGWIRFDTTALTITAIRTPSGEDGEVRVVNTEEARSGAFRFAAYATEHLASTEMLTIVATPRQAGVPRIEATLDVAGTTKGAAYARSRMFASDGIIDAQGRRLR